MNNPTPQNSAPTSEPRIGKSVFRVDPATYIIIGFFSSCFLFFGLDLWLKGSWFYALLAIGAGSWIFCFICFQKLVFEDGSMLFCRPFFPVKQVKLSQVTLAEIVFKVGMSGFSARAQWVCRLSGATTLLCEFNPKPFSLEAIDYLYSEVRRHSPNAEIKDGTQWLRRKNAKK